MTAPVSLERFLQDAEKGIKIDETLNDGSVVEFTIHHPNQETMDEITELLGRIMAANPNIAGAAVEGEQIEISDPSVIAEMKRMNTLCLVGCIRTLNRDNVSAVESLLDPNGAVMTKCRSLCGLSSVTPVTEDEEGN